MPNSQHNELKPGIKDGTEVTCEYEHFLAKQKKKKNMSFKYKTFKAECTEL